MRSKLLLSVALICMFVFLFGIVAEAKPSIDFEFYKNDGYGIGDEIGGVWTITAKVSTDVQYVEFYLDGQFQQNDSTAPFSWQFDTLNYPAGSHAIKALAYDSLGESAMLQVTRDFQDTPTFAVMTPILAAVIVIVVAAFGFAIFRLKKAKKTN
jgi:hypothetical protein